MLPYRLPLCVSWKLIGYDIEAKKGKKTIDYLVIKVSDSPVKLFPHKDQYLRLPVSPNHCRNMES